MHRLNLAQAYKALGYPDLAAGDAYKALLLVDEVVQEGEYHEEAREAANVDFLSEKMATLALEKNAEAISTESDELENWARTNWSKRAYVRGVQICSYGL